MLLLINKNNMNDDSVDDIMSLLGIYTKYFNKKNNTSGNLFKNIDTENKHSINDRILELLEHIKYYKQNKDTDNASITDKNKKYYLAIGDKKLYSNSLISLMIKLRKYEWNKIIWDLNST